MTTLSQSLADYLQACRKRLKYRFAARGTAVIAIGALAITALTALLFVSLVPSSGWIVAARVLLYTGLAAGIGLLLWRPLTERQVTSDIESRVPAFDGRLTTWRDSTERGDDSALLGLLTRESAGIAAQSTPQSVIPGKDIALPVAGTALLVAALLFITTGISPFQLAAQRLWTGDLFTAAAPRLTVSPGDTVIPRGTDVVIEAAASGFVARGMEMHADFEGTDGWETAPMSRLGEGRYGFVFVGVNEEVQYYVSSSGLNSTRHVIHVADLPKVIEVSLAYTYPDWTELPVVEQKNGDVAALPGTAVSISATTDRPLEDPLIVVNGEVLNARTDPASGGLIINGDFEVGEPGSWHVAVMHESALARISDTFFIDVVADRIPEVAFSWPGHDVQATPIEERTLRFRATDDYGVKALTFSYSVNGGEWNTADLEIPADPDAHAEHILYLEDLRIASPVTGEPARPLKPGDMISFYAEAHDHSQQAKTALYFTDIRPFDRVYRESQSAAGQGNQGGGGADELVQRQREILTATWNLINKTEEREGPAPDDDQDDDQVDVLALLQNTLKDQVTTLIQRVDARRLTTDDTVDTFTQELTAAAEDMAPAADRLSARALADAIAPEQQALQHLLAAKATMTDVDVSMSQADMRGTAGRSLSELMDLEMDQERNRYETPQNPSTSNQARQEDEEWQRLAELAARQEQLTEQQRRGQESLASRWQQERLQRELEKLQEELNRRQQNQQNNQSSQRQSPSSSSSQSQQSMENAIAELNEARQAIDRSLQQAQGDPGASRQATEALQRAAEQLRENAIGNMDERLARTEGSVQNLLSDQRNIMDRLDDVQSDALKSAPGERRFDDDAMKPYAERKRRMQGDLNTITREIGEMGDAIDDAETRRALEQATIELARERVDERLAASADAFEFGRPLYAIGNEPAVERALEQLSSRISQARRLLESSDGQAGEQSTLAQVRALRSQLGDAATRNNTGGGFDTSDMNTLVRRADALEFRVGQALGEALEFDTAISRQAYRERGTDAANNEALVQIMKDRLDLIEAALLNLEAAPIRAQEPRDKERDSEAAARYFRDLGRSEG